MLFFGGKSHIIHIEHRSKHKSLVSCIQDFVRKYRAPICILADHASYHQSFLVLSYLQILWIKLWLSEAYYHHQNPFEQHYQTFKQIVNKVMDRTNTPPNLWFLCMKYVAYVLNQTLNPTLGNKQPILRATGTVGDISPIL